MALWEANHPNKSVVGTPQCQILHQIFYSVYMHIAIYSNLDMATGDNQLTQFTGSIRLPSRRV